MDNIKKTRFVQKDDGSVEKKKTVQHGKPAEVDSKPAVKAADGSKIPVAHRTSSDVAKSNAAYKASQGGLAHLVKKPKPASESVETEDETVEFSDADIASLENIDGMLDAVENNEPAKFQDFLNAELAARVNARIDGTREEISASLGMDGPSEEGESEEVQEIEQGDAGDETDELADDSVDDHPESEDETEGE